MKPTGATKDDDSWIDQLLDIVAHARDVDQRVAARLQIKHAVNERERLREAAQRALELLPYLRPTGGWEHAYRFTRDELRAVLNNATPSTSASGG